MIQKAYKNIIDIISLNNSDVMLASFPKTGSTWLRFFICNYILILKGESKDVDFRFLNDNMPELGFNLHKKQVFFENYSRVVKTHKKFMPIFKNKKVIYVIRNPQDTMKSLFLYNQNMLKPSIQVDSFKDFIRSSMGIESYLKHYKSWEPHIGHLVKFEDLKKDTTEEFKKVLMYLDYPLDADKVNQAMELSDSKNIAKLDNIDNSSHKEKLKQNYVFAGNNAKKANINFDNEDVEYLEMMIEKYTFKYFPF